MDYTKFLQHIKTTFNLQSYSLDEGFSKFVQRATGALDVVDREPFEWRDNDGNDVTVYVTITNKPIKFDEDGDPYIFETEYTAHASK